MQFFNASLQCTVLRGCSTFEMTAFLDLFEPPLCHFSISIPPCQKNKYYLTTSNPSYNALLSYLNGP